MSFITQNILLKNKGFSKKVYYIVGMRNSKFTNADGVEYELLWKKPHYKYNAEGLCCSPETDDPKILIDPTLKNRRKMSVLIEEITHAFFWEKSEREVRKFSSTLAKLIQKNIKEPHSH